MPSKVWTWRGSADAQSRAEAVRRKLERINIPRLEFREATIREAIDFLQKKSFELDADSPVGERGVNIVLKLEPAPSATPGLPLPQTRGSRFR